jgi:hypothetical protein
MPIDSWLTQRFCRWPHLVACRILKPFSLWYQRKVRQGFNLIASKELGWSLNLALLSSENRRQSTRQMKKAGSNTESPETKLSHITGYNTSFLLAGS